MKINQPGNNRLLGAGVLAALAASLCCLTPVLALLGGISGLAASFSWLEPFRPFLIGTTVLVLGLAWYQKLKPRPAAQMDCACEADKKPSFFQSKGFLSLITVLAASLLSFPYYSAAFFPAKENTTATMVPTATTVNAKLYVKGMTCSVCEQSVNHALRESPGVIKAHSAYSTGTAEVTFDQSKIDLPKLAHAITEATGYQVTGYELINQK